MKPSRLSADGFGESFQLLGLRLFARCFAPRRASMVGMRPAGSTSTQDVCLTGSGTPDEQHQSRTAARRNPPKAEIIARLQDEVEDRKRDALWVLHANPIHIAYTAEGRSTKEHGACSRRRERRKSLSDGP